MAIPTRILEEIKNSEVNAENFYSIYGKENIEAALNDLKKSDEEILNTYSIQAMRAAVQNKLNKNADNAAGSATILKSGCSRLRSADRKQTAVGIGQSE